MPRRKLSRRHVLRGTAGSVVALPFLSAMDGPGVARAGGPALPKRIMFLSYPGGRSAAGSVVPGTRRDFDLGATVDLAPLAPYADDIIVVDNVDDLPGIAHPYVAGHESTTTKLVGTLPIENRTNYSGLGAAHASLDQEIASRLSGTTRFDILTAGCAQNSTGQGGDGGIYSQLSWRGANDPVHIEGDPAKLFASIFADVEPGGSEPSPRRRQRQSVLDTTQEQIEDILPLLGAEDRVRLEEHLDSIRRIELSLDQDTAAACTIPRPPEFPEIGDAAWKNGTYEDLSVPRYQEYIRAELDMFVHAFACDLTRVGLMMMDHFSAKSSFPGLGFPDLGKEGGGEAQHHGLQHFGYPGGPVEAEFGIVQAWYVEQAAYLIGQLASIPDGEGRLLDNTVVVLVPEMAEGWSHSMRNEQWVLAGSCGGALDVGQLLRFAAEDEVGHNHLLVTLLNAMGFEDETFGDPAYGEGPFSDVLTGRA